MDFFFFSLRRKGVSWEDCSELKVLWNKPGVQGMVASHWLSCCEGEKESVSFSSWQNKVVSICKIQSLFMFALQVLELGRVWGCSPCGNLPTSFSWGFPWLIFTLFKTTTFIFKLLFSYYKNGACLFQISKKNITTAPITTVNILVWWPACHFALHLVPNYCFQPGL